MTRQIKEEMKSETAQSLLNKYERTLHNFQDASPSRGIALYLAAARQLRIMLGISNGVEMEHATKFDVTEINEKNNEDLEKKKEATTSSKRRHEIILRYLNESANAGNPEAHRMLGMIHSIGLLDVASNPSVSLLHYHQAASAGDMEAAMAMGFRHHHGVGVANDCDAAVVYYEYAANAAMEEMDQHALLPWQYPRLRRWGNGGFVSSGGMHDLPTGDVVVTGSKSSMPTDSEVMQ
jgi:TPR repeat protein